MECSDVFNLLCSYIDGELSPDKMDYIGTHLVSCSACRRELELQQAMKLLLRERLSSLTAPAFLVDKVKFELGRAEEYRESGIQFLDLIRWGTHVAQFYNKRDEIAETLAPYMREGLRDNELCVWIVSEMSEDEVQSVLAAQVPDLQEYSEKQQMQIFSFRDWYVSDGCFDLQKALDGIDAKYQEAMSNGYLGLRITGDSSWLARSDWGSFMEYETLINDAIPDQKALAICAYSEPKCTTSDIADVMDRHKYAISKIDDSWQIRKSAEIQ